MTPWTLGDVFYFVAVMVGGVFILTLIIKLGERWWTKGKYWWCVTCGKPIGKDLAETSLSVKHPICQECYSDKSKREMFLSQVKTEHPTYYDEELERFRERFGEFSSESSERHRIKRGDW